jgi:uncharacterized protein
MVIVMKNSLRWLLLILTLCSFSFTADAAQVKNLYQADVASSASNWQQLALEQVLIRVSGQADIAQQAAIKAELGQVSAYIKQFTAVRQNGENITRVLLDPARVNRLLQQNNIAVWGELRPDTLIWLVQQDASGRQFIRHADHDLISNLKRAFNQAALPLLLPLYDMDDLVNISESDVWAGFWQQINQASNRYNADVVIAATIDTTTVDNALQWRLTWQRQNDGRIIREQFTADDEASLMQGFAAKLAQQLAAQYASVLSEQAASTVVINVEAVSSLTELVKVQQLLEQLVGVSQVTISRYSEDKASYSIQTAISGEGLLKALQFNNQFKLQPYEPIELAIDSSVMPALATFRYLRH